MKRVIVTGDTFSSEQGMRLRAHGLEVISAPGDLDEMGLIAQLDGAWGYVLGGSERVSRHVFEAIGLEVMCFLGTGYESFWDLDAARSSNIQLCYTPYANVQAVSEMTIGLMIALRRNIVELSNQTKQGRWSEELSPSLVGGRLGIVGLGRIGACVASASAAALGMEVRFWNRTPRPEESARLGARQVALHELLAWADAVSVHCGYDPKSTRGLIGADEFAVMRAGCVLINTARAEVVDPAALRDALVQDRIAGAAFDGYYVEPVPSPEEDKHGLLGLPDGRLIVTPHVAYLTDQAIANMSSMAVDNLLAAQEGAVLPHPVAL